MYLKTYLEDQKILTKLRIYRPERSEETLATIAMMIGGASFELQQHLLVDHILQNISQVIKQIQNEYDTIRH